MQPTPVGNAGIAPRDPLVQNSSFRPVESLSSVQKNHIPLKERLNHQDSFSDFDQPSGLSLQGDEASEPVVQNANQNQSEQEREARIEQEHAKQALLQEQRQISQLSARDREVKAHEQAHAAVGGQYAGAPSYQFERGPDGVNYAVAGEVSISTGKESTPQETIQKAQIVRRAALAPAEPSPQDRRVASIATRMESQARAEAAQLQRIENEIAKEEKEVQEAEENKASENAERANASTSPSEDDSSAGEASSPSVSTPNTITSSASSVSALTLNSTERPIVEAPDPFEPNAVISSFQSSNAVNEILAISEASDIRPGAILDLLA